MERNARLRRSGSGCDSEDFKMSRNSREGCVTLEEFKKIETFYKENGYLPWKLAAVVIEELRLRLRGSVEEI